MTSPVRALPATPRPVREVARAPERRSVRHLEVVRSPARHRRTGALVALVVVVVFASLLAAALVHSQVVSGQAHLDKVERKIDLERDQLALDRQALADHQSPARIAEAASALGMVRATSRTVLSNDGTSSVVVGTPEPATGTSATDPVATDTPATKTPASATDTPATDTPATDTPVTDTQQQVPSPTGATGGSQP